MTRIKLSTVLALALALAPSFAWSLAVPADKAAVVEAVIGKVQLISAGKESTPKVGQALVFGDVLSTGANGRVSLRHAGNAVSRMAPNTELTLKAPGAKKGTFLGLSKGFVRYLVGKRAPGESFEVQTSNAVAAVKGTDAETGTDGKKTTSRVFSSGREKALELLSLGTGKSVTLAPGQAAELDADGFTSREITRDEFEASKAQFEGLPTPEVEEAQEEAKQEAAEESQEASALGDAISDAFGDLMADLGIDSLIERDERTGDVAASRIAFDRNGDRTQISSWVVRADDKTIAKATYSQRKTGPFAGTSFAEETTVWNQTLPVDWASIATNYLDSEANTDGNGNPIWWRELTQFRAGNPQGDLMRVQRTYERPYFDYYFDGETYYRYGLQRQGFTQLLWLNNIPTHGMSWLAYPVGDPAMLLADAPGSEDSYEKWMNWGETYDSVTLNYAVFSEEPPFLSTDIRVLDMEGNAQEITEGLVYAYPDHLYAFRGVNSQYNIELTFNSPVFSAPIDLLVIPDIFNHFEMFEIPGYEYYPPNNVVCECCDCES